MMEHGKQSHSKQHALVRPVALFLDGMSRAVILPFGPSLVYRLVTGNLTLGPNGTKLGSDCAQVAYPLAIVVAAYLLGRSFGNSVALRLEILPNALPKYVARLSGVSIALHVFTLGAGLTSVWWLVMIRFLSATLVGVLCFITKPPSPEEEDELLLFESPENRLESGQTHTHTKTLDDQRGMKRRDGYVDIGSGTAKIYMVAFSVSILSGGLLYRHAAGDATFQELTGVVGSISSLFLVAVSVLAESVLRCVFYLFGGSSSSTVTTDKELKNQQQDLSYKPQQQQQQQQHRLTSPAATYATADQLHVSPHKPSRDTEDKFEPLRDGIGSTNLTPVRRTRLDTGESAEFFDCNSVISGIDFPLDDDMMCDNDSDEEIGHANQEQARFVDHKCVYGNGSPAFCPTGDSSDQVPPNYLAVCSGKAHKAEEMWKATQRWRHEHNVWRIHTMPNTYFPKIKTAYPHFIHGFSKQGYPIIYEQPGKMNLKQLFRDGCDIEDMVRHYMFFMEYVSNYVCTRPEVRAKLGPNPPRHNASSWGTMVVMDVKGAGVSHLSGDVLRYLSRAGDINNSHYPTSMKRVFVVNSPFWLAGAWSGVKGILPESVQVDLLSASKYGAALRDYVDEDQIPPEYGGTSPYRLGQHPFELELCELVEQAKHGDEDPAPVPPPGESASGDVEYSFDYNTGSWSTEVDGVAVKDGSGSVPPMANSSWRGQLSQTNSRPLRRRAASTDQHQHPSRSSSFVVADEDTYDDDSYDDKKGEYGGETDIFVIVSIMYTLWSAIQGVIETAIPFWILIPTEFGGLGYAPSRSGVTLFCSLMMLLWVMRTKVSKVISQIPTKAPMRAFRVGVGAECALLTLLALVPKCVR
jgi:hypothetical protein